MLRYWARDLYRRWNKRIVVLFIVLSILLSNLVSIAETDFIAGDSPVLICGHTQHQHTDACYEEVQIPVEENRTQNKSMFSIHHHSDECYDGEGRLICGLTEDKYYHRHTDSCMNDEGSLICGLAENELYIEPEIKTERILTCGLEEHVHGPDCYETPTGQVEEQKPEAAEEDSEKTSPETTAPITEADDISEAATADSKDTGETAEQETTDPAAEDVEPNETETAKPENAEPGTTDPETIVPETTEGESAGPEATEPNTKEPETAESEAVEQKATEPETTESETAEPADKPLFEIRDDILIRYNGDEKVVTVPDGIRKIEKKAFYIQQNH